MAVSRSDFTTERGAVGKMALDAHDVGERKLHFWWVGQPFVFVYLDSPCRLVQVYICVSKCEGQTITDIVRVELFTRLG